MSTMTEAHPSSHPPTHYHLWMSPFSLPCLMIRYTFLSLQTQLPATERPTLEEHEVDLSNLDQLGESFLREINPKGQVPVLVNSRLLNHPLTESLDTGLLLAEQYNMLRGPQSQTTTTTDLLRELHALNYFTLTLGRTAAGVHIIHKSMTAVENKLAAPDITPFYRDALQQKHQHYKSIQDVSSDPDHRAEEDKKAADFMDKLTRQMDIEGPWIWGKEGPCILDTHVVPFLVRMKDAGRGDALPDRLRRCVERAETSPVWRQLMQGRGTLPLVEG